MKKLVKTTTYVSIGAKVINYLASGGTEQIIINNGDVVTDLKYIDNEEVKTITGKVVDIGTIFYRESTGRKNTNSLLTKDAKISSITIDASKKQEACVVQIPKDSLLDYGASEEVERVEWVPYIEATICPTLSDGSESEVTLKEGTVLVNPAAIDGIVYRNIEDGIYTVKSFLYKFVPNKKAISVVGVNLVGEKTYQLSFTDFLDMGSEAVVADSSEFSSAFDSVEDGGALVTNAGEVVDAVTINKSIIISGAQASISAATGARATDEIEEDETVLKGKLTISDDTSVLLQGLTLTESSLVTIGKASGVTIKNCKILGFTLTATKNYGIMGSWDKREDTKGCVLKIEGCYFGSNPTDGSNKLYNLLELQTKLANGSYIKDCYFKKEACTHNAINLYDVMDDCEILIENNHFEYSANAIRVGFINAPQNVIVRCINNIYDATDTNDPEWAGLIFVQPYVKQTTDFSGVTIYLDGTKNNSGVDQLGYIYCGPSDTLLDEDTLPRIYVDNETAEFPFLVPN